MWLVFNFLSDGLFLSPRNLWNLSVQSAAVGIMTTGMVLIIVSRNIDLSIGSILAVTALVMGLLQTEWIPNALGLGLNHPFIWIIALAVGIALGALIGGLHGFLIAYFGIPSFIVTLGGLLIWRGASFGLVSGRTIGPLDSTFQLLGGGPRGSLGETMSWLVAAVAIVVIIYVRCRRPSPPRAAMAFPCGRSGRRSRSAPSPAWSSPARCGSRTATRGRPTSRRRTPRSTGSRSHRAAS